MKITDSPGAMLVMPLSATAAAKALELSSIFQPVMSTGAGADVRHLEPVGAIRAVAAAPRRHLGDDRRWRDDRSAILPGEPVSCAIAGEERAVDADDAQGRDGRQRQRRAAEAGRVVEREAGRSTRRS